MSTNNSEAQIKVKVEQNQTAKKRYTISWTERADLNVKKQRKAYMKKHGESISMQDLACKLLETARVI